jgi:hypothetical protein
LRAAGLRRLERAFFMIFLRSDEYPSRYIPYSAYSYPEHVVGNQAGTPSILVPINYASMGQLPTQVRSLFLCLGFVLPLASTPLPFLKGGRSSSSSCCCCFSFFLLLFFLYLCYCFSFFLLLFFFLFVVVFLSFCYSFSFFLLLFFLYLCYYLRESIEV